MSDEPVKSDWMQKPVLLRVHDLIMDVQQPPEEIKQTLIDIVNDYTDLVHDVNRFDEDEDDDDDDDEEGWCYES
jgi:hypothetical protein